MISFSLSPTLTGPVRYDVEADFMLIKLVAGTFDRVHVDESFTCIKTDAFFDKELVSFVKAECLSDESVVLPKACSGAAGTPCWIEVASTAKAKNPVFALDRLLKPFAGLFAKSFEFRRSRRTRWRPNLESR
jgi:hypothetical protein